MRVCFLSFSFIDFTLNGLDWIELMINVFDPYVYFVKKKKKKKKRKKKEKKKKNEESLFVSVFQRLSHRAYVRSENCHNSKTESSLWKTQPLRCKTSMFQEDPTSDDELLLLMILLLLLIILLLLLMILVKILLKELHKDYYNHWMKFVWSYKILLEPIDWDSVEQTGKGNVSRILFWSTNSLRYFSMGSTKKSEKENFHLVFKKEKKKKRKRRSTLDFQAIAWPFENAPPNNFRRIFSNGKISNTNGNYELKWDWKIVRWYFQSLAISFLTSRHGRFEEQITDQQQRMG